MLADPPPPSPSSTATASLTIIRDPSQAIDEAEEDEDDSDSDSDNSDNSDDSDDSDDEDAMSAIMRRTSASETSESHEKWRQYFQQIINVPIGGKDEQMRRRIIFLNNSETMAETFHEWWPALAQAVRERRGGGKAPVIKQRKGARKPSQEETTRLVRPTTIVLGCAPSMLRVNRRDSAARSADSDDPNSLSTHLRALQARMEERLDELKEDIQERTAERPALWWSSVEKNTTERAAREDFRLRELATRPETVYPLFGRRKSFATSMRAMMESQRTGSARPDQTLFTPVYDTFSVKRSKAVEKIVRQNHRLRINAALTARAMNEFGGRLRDPLSSVSDTNTDIPGGKISENFFQTEIVSMKDARKIATSALYMEGKRSEPSSTSKDTPEVTWSHVLAALASKVTSQIAKRLRQQANEAPQDESSSRNTPMGTDEIAKAKRTMNDKEKEILSNCLVSPEQVASTTYDDVHLPPATIDAIRSTISLPLLYPEAFRAGILRKYVTAGALLFGPPGTGKTLLARAVANEGNARMLLIKGSDVQDKFVGESEQKVKAIFSVARQLSPCIVFIDEMESLLPHRMNRRYATSINSTVTEFMQELDGLSSSVDKNVIVLGATNRPYDMDSAAIRRLPRRILVDLPRLDGRKAILRIMLKDNKLADDVTVDWMASLTEGYSGSDLKNFCVAAALAAVKDTVKLPWKTDKRESPPVLSAGLSSPTDAESASAPADQAQGKKKVGRPRKLEDPAAVGSTSSTTKVVEEQGRPESDTRVLSKRHFETALREIKPSSSEDGIAELRKWARQYGEGGDLKGRKQGFGKGFGFADPDQITPGDSGYGRVTED